MRRAAVLLWSALQPFAFARGALAQAAPGPTKAPAAWIERSDANARLILESFARFSPEGAGRLGLEGYDEQVLDLKPDVFERSRKAMREVQASLDSRRAAETDAAVRQDLDILVEAVKDNIEGAELNRRFQIDYFDIPQTVFQGIRALLDDQVPAARRAKALVRLRRYAGLEPGSTPITTLAQERTRERLKEPGLVGPFKGEVEKNLANSASYVDGIPKLFEKYQIAGYEPAFAKLKEQLAAYDAFLLAEVLPRARADYRLPPELLREEVVLSEPMAKQEVERCTFRAPGQATSYFYGYLRWMQMKAETEMALGPKFDRQRYHDFILAQGLLPPALIDRAVREQFVPAEKSRAD